MKRFADYVNKVPTAAVSEYTAHDAIVKGLQEQSRLAVTRLLETENHRILSAPNDTGFR